MTIPSCKFILISCEHYVLMSCFFAMGHLVGLSPKNYEILYFSNKNYIILHGHVKSYKYLFFALTLFYIAI